MLIEGHRAIVLAHVNFELPGGTPPLPAVIRVPRAEVAFAGTEHQPALGHELNVKKTEQQSAEVRKVGDRFSAPGGGSANRTHQSNEHDPGNEILRPHAERNREQHDLAVTVDQPEAHKDAVNSTGCTHGDRPWAYAANS